MGDLIGSLDYITNFEANKKVMINPRLVYIFFCLMSSLMSSLNSAAQLTHTFLGKRAAQALALVVDENEQVYYADYNMFKIKELDAQGLLVNEFGVMGPGPTEFEASDVTFDNDGNLQIADNHFERIQVYTTSGTFVKTITLSGGILATDIANDVDGKMYIVEALRHRILVLNEDGTFGNYFGSEGTANGEFKYPSGIALTANRIYVTDGSNNRVQVFDKNFSFLFNFGIGTDPVQLSSPKKIAIVSSIVYVADGSNYIRYYDLDGNYLGRFGGGGSTDDTFSYITDIFVANGKLYVADYYNQYIKIFSSNRLPQLITYNPLTNRTFGDPPFELDATSNSGLEVVYNSSNPSIASVSGNQVTIHMAGTVSITASQPGDQLYLEAAPVARELIIEKANQEIIFSTLEEKVAADNPFDLSAISNSGLPVSFSSSNTSVISISGKTATIVGGGEATITAWQPGNENYNAAPEVFQTQIVNKLSQSISFEALNERTWGDPSFSLEAVASSGLPVVFSVPDNPVAFLIGEHIIITGTGSVLITASQSGNSVYSVAPSITNLLVVKKKKQSIFFDAIPVKRETDDPFQIYVFSTSELDITLSIDDPSIATISPTREVTILKPGKTTIRANQTGNDLFEAATEITRQLQVDIVTGLEEISDISIYPNPGHDFVHIQFPSLLDFSVQIRNSLGTTVTANTKVIGNDLQFDVRDFPKGLYFFRIQNQSNSKVFRFLKD